jgi:centrosomal protein CEP250
MVKLCTEVGWTEAWEGIHSLFRMSLIPPWQVELLRQEVKEKEADFMAQEAQLLEELEASRITEQQLRASLWAQEAKAAQMQLRLRNTESQLEALVTEQQPGNQAQAQLASLYSVLQQAFGFVCENRPELRGGGDSAHSLWDPEPGEATNQELSLLYQSQA